MIYPLFDEYMEYSKAYNLVPVYEEVLVDMDTPISIFRKVCRGQDNYLLESVEGGENLARYSFIGLEPIIRFEFSHGLARVEDSEGVIRYKTDPLQGLQEIMQRFTAPKISDLPRFYGGAVGYFGYDLVRYVEDLPNLVQDDLGMNEGYFIITGLVLIFDHVKHKVKIVVNSQPGTDVAGAYHEASKRIKEIKNLIHGDIKVRDDKSLTQSRRLDFDYPSSNMTKQEYIEKVLKAQEYIKAGDIFQVVLSQRLKMPLYGEAFDVYRNLRTLNPAPYLYYLNFGGTVIIGSSPEMLIRVEDNRIQTCPIAGTRPRGVDNQQDSCFEKDLLADHKEKAEHLMLVDLGRNDLGRVCDYGSIEVNGFMEVERYSHVMHLVSNVSGRLKTGKTCFDALRACFPAGTVSGAPKVRAMQIIEELEPTRRGVYAGVIGYFGFTGNMDTCITIRTILIHEGVTYIQAGAGIVADSQPELEYEETLNKAKAMLETLMLKEVG